jgi:hypothetical protein
MTPPTQPGPTSSDQRRRRGTDQHRRLHTPRGPPGSGVETQNREGRTQPNVLTVATQTKTDNPHKGCPPHSSKSMTETYPHVLIQGGRGHRPRRAEVVRRMGYAYAKGLAQPIASRMG